MFIYIIGDTEITETLHPYGAISNKIAVSPTFLRIAYRSLGKLFVSLPR